MQLFAGSNTLSAKYFYKGTALFIFSKLKHILNNIIVVINQIYSLIMLLKQSNPVVGARNLKPFPWCKSDPLMYICRIKNR
jgi:hypothetical protein